MFKKPQLDLKKSMVKVLDVKKDALSRSKHLKGILETLDSTEAKNFFEQHYSHLYYLFFDCLSCIEAPLKQKGYKQVKEELESALFIFEKIITLLPELLHKKWQYHSIRYVLQKMLHYGNSVKTRQEGIRLFLVWYMILGGQGNNDVEHMFSALVPGIVPKIQNEFIRQHPQPPASGNQFRDPGLYAEQVPEPETIAEVFGNSQITPCEIEPMAPMLTGEPQPQDVTCYYLQCLMDYMVSQVSKVQWKEQRSQKHTAGFEYLFDKFKEIYLPHVFPSFNQNFSYYKSVFDVNAMQAIEDDSTIFDPTRFPHRDTLLHCKAIVIRWLAKYMRNEDIDAYTRKDSVSELSNQRKLQHTGSISSADSLTLNDWREPSTYEYEIVQSSLTSKRESVDLIHEVFRQAFLLPFTHAVTMRKVVAVYKDWIYKSYTTEPLFLQEPPTHPVTDDVRGGVACMLRTFVTSASQIFLLSVPPEKPLLLEEQVDMCKRVLNIYRYIVMKVEMCKATWERLLHVLLKITSLVLNERFPARKDDNLGVSFRLAPAFFQTLIVTWIKANLNVHISNELWEVFQKTLSSLTRWEELIKEWSKTMDTTTRIMARYVYNINLHDLPLDRPSERKAKRSMLGKRANTNSSNSESITTRENEISNHNSVQASGEGNCSVPSGLIRSASDSQLISASERRYSRNKKSKSLEALPLSIQCESSSRSPSPTLSSGVDSHSLKDSPMHLDSCSVHSNEAQISSVIVGGSARGWSCESAVILWRRMLGVLGDINLMEDPALHQQAMQTIEKMMDDLLKVKENIGATGAIETPLTPPLDYLSPWLLQALQLPDEFKAGKLVALKVLCCTVVRKGDFIAPELLTLFYDSIHKALCSFDPEIISTVIKHCNARIFTIGLPGASCLLFDFINATNVLTTSPDVIQVPRSEAISLLGTLIGMDLVFKDILSLKPNAGTEPVLVQFKDMKEHILNMLIKGSKREPTGQGRCIALNSLGLFLYQELENRSNHSKLLEIATVLLAGTKFSNRVLSRIACDMIRLQCDHAMYLVGNLPEIPRVLIEGLISSLSAHWKLAKSQNLYKDYKNLLLSIIFTLGEWCLCVPKRYLISYIMTSNGHSTSLLEGALYVLGTIGNDSEVELAGVQNGSDPIADNGMDYNIAMDNLHDSPSKRRTLAGDSKDLTLTRSNDSLVIQMAGNAIRNHLVYYCGQYPLPGLGASSLSSDVSELEQDDGSNVQYFSLNNGSLVSFVENMKDDQNRESRTVRAIVRDFLGKRAWSLSSFNVTTDSYQRKNTFNDCIQTNLDIDDDFDVRSRKEDQLDSLLRNLSESSPECRSEERRLSLNAPSPATNSVEENMIALLNNQNYQELNYIEEIGLKGKPKQLTEFDLHGQGDELDFDRMRPRSDFKSSRQVIEQFGYLLWEKRSHMDILEKSEQLFREIRNLDKQGCRETHKIAVIYVAKGQKDKKSILSNKCGSKAFEDMVAGLGWEVELENHQGFIGGLHRNGSTGTTAPYYANSFVEVMFHVSTRLSVSSSPDNDGDCITQKFRHIGNDEVHIVWSEHSQDYRRSIIPTEFCDVLIVVYPISEYPNHFRIQINRKPEVPFFGPLFNGSVVHQTTLPGLLRATAVNASRAHRLQVPMYQYYFEERQRLIDNITERHTSSICFEDFVSKAYSPSTLGLLTQRSRSSSSEISGQTEEFIQRSPLVRTRPASISSFDQSVHKKASLQVAKPERPLSDCTTSPVTSNVNTSRRD